MVWQVAEVALASVVVGKVEGREVFHHRPGFLLVVVVHYSLYPVYIHVYTHTYSASCSCDLEPEPTNSHRSVSLFFDLSIRAEKSSAMKIDATFVICGTERLFVFSKKENYRFYIYFIERNFYKAWIIFRTSLKGIHVAERG